VYHKTETLRLFCDTMLQNVVYIRTVKADGRATCFPWRHELSI